MYRITITDTRSSQTETSNANGEQVMAIRKILNPTKEESRKVDPGKDVTLLAVDPTEFEKVARVDMVGNRIVEDVKFIEHMNGQRISMLRKEDTFTPESPDVFEVEEGVYALKIYLDPARHGGKRVRMVKLVPKD